MVLLIKYCFAGSGRTPTHSRPLLILPIGEESFVTWAAPNQFSGSLNTTTSPRFISLQKVAILLTAIRSPTLSVFSMEPEGIKKK